MTTSEIDKIEEARWYVLNHVGGPIRNAAQKEVERFNTAENTGLELFAPTAVVRENKEGQVKLRETKLTFHYVFVKGVFEMVKKLCVQTNGFSFLIDRGNENRYAVIENSEMVHFMNIARAYNNCLPYFSLEDVDLEEGDLVEFPGPYRDVYAQGEEQFRRHRAPGIQQSGHDSLQRKIGRCPSA